MDLVNFAELWVERFMEFQENKVKQQYKQQMNRLGSRGTPFLFIIDFSIRQPVLIPLHEIDSTQLLYDFNGFTNLPEQLITTNEATLSFEKFPLDFTTYKRSFDKVMYHLQAGNSFLVNLTLPTPIAINRSLQDIFYQSKASYKLWYQDKFVVFSPEPFVKIRGGKIYSYPMKGTIDSSLHNAEEKLLSDPKEIAEHVTIVDLIRNDLSYFASDVQVKRFRFVEEVQTYKGKLLQVSSEISGHLAANYWEQLGDILMSMLPAGSISGAPKPKTLEIIREAEGYERGYYTGVMGIFDGKNLDSAVMIRYIEKQGRQYIYKSGGGITARSQVETEYQELIDKVYVPFA
ncbi:aminodeoxychorismate synthase component I [Catalinimonas niigatensis]|uniref:aminodeoxychorismate synthase component I n=1 Tax=Catalinimonas niigatensis TaxID=1397264 RepID=UPI00266535EE|nr:aminodeoxychorismate synthase component I [Catalinimonas niigatensis]WPP48637.1 aminodeoxychorismate synthase component I [Catalinimonas niigatensis]